MFTNPIASTSNTAVASGYVPMRGGSPVMQIRFRTPCRVRAQQLRLDAQNIAVAATEMVHGLDARLLLNQLARYLCAHAGAGARPIRHVDAIDAVPCAQLRAFDLARRVHAARRKNLHERHELARRQLRAQLRFLRHRHRFERVRFGSAALPP